MTSTRLCEQRYPTGKKDGKLTLLVKSKGTKWGRVLVMLGQGTSGEVKMVGRPKNEHSLPTKKQTNSDTSASDTLPHDWEHFKRCFP